MRPHLQHGLAFEIMAHFFGGISSEKFQCLLVIEIDKRFLFSLRTTTNILVLSGVVTLAFENDVLKTLFCRLAVNDVKVMVLFE